MDREQLIAAMTARKPIEVQLSFGTVHIVPLTRAQFDHCTELTLKFNNEPTAVRQTSLRWYMTATCLVDESGKKLLDVNSREDRATFDTWTAGDSEALTEAIVNSSRVSKEDRDFLLRG